MMKRVIRSAVTMVLASAGLVVAQQRVDLSGANDANNKIGSGGRNIVSEQPKAWQYANDIVTGNVTGGKQFRGNISSGDPFAFRGNTGFGNFDRFIRDSSGISTSGQSSYNANDTRAYYGESRAAPAPAGYEQIAGGGGYVPPKPTGWRTVDPRVGAVNDSTTYVFRPDIYGGAGAVELQAAPNAIAVPGTIKAGKLDPIGLSDYTSLNRDLSSQLSGQQLQQIQSEITSKTGTQFQPTTPETTTTTPNTNQMITKPLNDSVDDSVKSGQVNSALTPDQVRLGSRSSVVMTAQEQAKADQQAMLQGKPIGSQSPDAVNQDAASKFNKDMQARQEAAGKDGTPQPGTPQNTPQNATPGDPANIPMIKKSDGKLPEIAPVRITGEDKKPGVNDMIKVAESQMREGKFSTAIDTYDAASKLSPRDLRIPLGRAHAELGGGFYRMAEIHLKQLFTFDKTLLANQSDLRGTIGEERLQVVERDLKEMLQKNEKDSGPAILQAYVYYNTSNERRAAALLEIADKRTGGQDPFVKLLRDNWTLPKIDGENK